MVFSHLVEMIALYGNEHPGYFLIVLAMCATASEAAGDDTVSGTFIPLLYISNRQCTYMTISILRHLNVCCTQRSRSHIS